MPPAKALKTSDKQALVKKVTTELKKRYGSKTPKTSRSVLETLLFAACLEDSSPDRAEQAYESLLDAFFDLNEIRVSSVTEIEHALGDLEDAAWKAMRLRDTLQHTFEKHYAFDLDLLRRKTQEAALKELSEIPYQTHFMRTYTVQHALATHVLPVDESITKVLIWLGLVEPTATPETASDELKASVKKVDAPLVCHLLKCLATDPQLQWAFNQSVSKDLRPDPFEGPKRLAQLIKNPKPPRPKKAAKKTKTVNRKKPAKKTKTSARKSVKKKSVKKKVTKKKPIKKKTKSKRR